MATSSTSHPRAGQASQFQGTEKLYLFPHHASQLERLQIQRRFMLSNVPEALLKIPLPPTGSKTINIIDVGCADGTWLLDVANANPQQDWMLHGADIHDGYFPKPEERAKNQMFHIYDAQKVPPPDWTGASGFDIVHQRLLIWALPADAWSAEIGHLYSMTKPGGWVQLVENYWVDDEDDSRSDVFKRLNLLQQWVSSSNDKDADIALKLKGLVEGAGFINVQEFVYKNGYGSNAKDPRWRAASADLLANTYRHLEHIMPKDGIPGVAKTPSELQYYLDELREDVFHNGYTAKMHCIIGQCSPCE